MKELYPMPVDKMPHNDLIIMYKALPEKTGGRGEKDPKAS
jgi:hypothetical protein